MNPELEALILAYERFSASRDLEADRYMQAFESLLDAVIDRRPGYHATRCVRAFLKRTEDGLQSKGKIQQPFRRKHEASTRSKSFLARGILNAKNVAQIWGFGSYSS